MVADIESGQVRECLRIRSDDRSARCLRRGCDQQIVRATRLALTAHLHEQLRMRLSDVKVVVHDGNCCKHISDEGRPFDAGLSAG